MSTSSNQCHSKLILVTSHEPPDHIMDICDGQNIDLKIRVDIWMRMDLIPVESGYFGMLLKLP